MSLKDLLTVIQTGSHRIEEKMNLLEPCFVDGHFSSIRNIFKSMYIQSYSDGNGVVNKRRVPIIKVDVVFECVDSNNPNLGYQELGFTVAVDEDNIDDFDEHIYEEILETITALKNNGMTNIFK